MASDDKDHVTEGMKALLAALPSLPPGEATTAVRDAAERVEAALRRMGYELGKPNWMTT